MIVRDGERTEGRRGRGTRALAALVLTEGTGSKAASTENRRTGAGGRRKDGGRGAGAEEAVGVGSVEDNDVVSRGLAGSKPSAGGVGAGALLRNRLGEAVAGDDDEDEDGEA